MSAGRLSLSGSVGAPLGVRAADAGHPSTASPLDMCLEGRGGRLSRRTTGPPPERRRARMLNVVVAGRYVRSGLLLSLRVVDLGCTQIQVCLQTTGVVRWC